MTPELPPKKQIEFTKFLHFANLYDELNMVLKERTKKCPKNENIISLERLSTFITSQ